MTSPASDPLSLTLERTIRAPIDRAFRAWTEPAQVSRWFGPGPEYPVLSADMDVRVGGAYRLCVADPEGNEYVVNGAYRVVEPPRVLSFTWAWELPGSAGRESTVTVELSETDAGVHLKLTHVGLLDEQAVRSHGEGWKGGLEQLVAFAESMDD